MKIVLTGSSSGIGRALASSLLQHGHRVWGLARSDQADFAAAHPGRFEAARCDVAHWAEVAAAAARVAAAWERIDGLVCAAGWQGEIGRTTAADPKRWSETVRVNLDGAFHAIRAFHPLLGRKGGPGRPKIVCFSGGGAARARPNFSAYGAAKTALVRLAETIAAEEGDKLDINAVAPGAVATRMTDEVLQRGAAAAGQAEVEAARQTAEKGAASAERAVALVEWLLSPASDGISGRLLSAHWDPWPFAEEKKSEIIQSDLYTLRRVDGRDASPRHP